MMTKIGRTANTPVGGITRRNHRAASPTEDLVPSIGARRRWQALMAIGHTEESVAPYFGPTVTRLPFRSDGPAMIPRAVHDLMVAVYKKLRDIPGPAVEGAAGRARQYGWNTAEQWDTADIDNPYSRPSSAIVVTDLSAGACRGHAQPDLWADQSPRAIARAKEICATQCPVRHDCLALALGTPEREGTWGGMSADERETHLPALEAATLKKGRALRGSPELEKFLFFAIGPRPMPEPVTTPSPRSSHRPIPGRMTAAAGHRGGR